MEFFVNYAQFTMGCVLKELKRLGLCLLALTQTKKLYLKRNMDCALKDIENPKSMSASTKPT